MNNKNIVNKYNLVLILSLAVALIIIFVFIKIWEMESLPNWSGGFVSALLVIVCIIIYLSGRKKERNKQYLLNQGIKITADFVKIDLVPDLKNPMIGNHYLTVKGIDPDSGRDKEYETVILGLNSKPAKDEIPSQFSVYIDPLDANNYYVDIKELTS